jgi:dTDP-4-dehydrorhamnose reductase
MLEPGTIWITGAGGLIGNYTRAIAKSYADAEAIRALTRADLDLTDFDAVQKKFREDSPQLIFHCAALSQSPACQNNPELARKLNVELTGLLVELATNASLVFFSTDLVFDGRKGNYDESAPINPLSVYAETKAEAERIVLANPRHIVIRTSLNGGVSPAGNRGFNEQLRQGWQRGETLNLFTDEFRNPIPAIVTAQAAWELALKKASGLFHVAGSEKLSRFALGQLIAARWPQLDPKMIASSLKEYRGAPRSPDTTLNCAKAQNHLSFPLPKLSEWLSARPAENF